MLNLAAAFNREPEPDRLAKLETYIERALLRTEGHPELAFRNLLALAESESVLGDLICDLCAVGFAKHFFRTTEHLSKN